MEELEEGSQECLFNQEEEKKKLIKIQLKYEKSETEN